MQKITILTSRVSVYAFIKKSLRNFLRFLKYILSSGIIDIDKLLFSGHTAVTKSLIHGLQEIKADFIYNPIFKNNVSNTVVVLSDMSALAQALFWKKEGKIKKLIAGPTLIEIPTKHNNALTSDEIDIVIVPSIMVKEIYEKLNPKLIGKIKVWYAGVDISYWNPAHKQKPKEVLVYWKDTTSKAFCLEVEGIIKKAGYKINRIRYGHYNKKYYKKMLDRSLFAVFLSITETQGLGLVEAWAMNVPTLVWSPEIEHYYLRGVITTSAPYLTENTGTKWKELDDLESLLTNNNLDLKTFSPRKWVLENMTDKISAEMLIGIINDLHK